MQQMHFYGSDDNNAKVQFTMNEKIMGSILSGKDYPSFNIIHNDADGEQADTIRLWRGYRNSGGLWAQVIQTSLNTNTAAFTDQSILGGIEYYYFVDIKQADGQWIVTSPIWYTFLSTVSMNESDKKQINVCYFPNPVSGLLNMSLTESGRFNVQILDLQGRLIFENMFSDKDITLNISEFSKGIYILKVSKGEFSVSKRLMVE
jgi:hypothetical protein